LFTLHVDCPFSGAAYKLLFTSGLLLTLSAPALVVSFCYRYKNPQAEACAA